MIVETLRGESPLIVVLPHTGQDVPPPIHARLNSTGRALADHDRDLDLLILPMAPKGASILRAGFHRYVSDCDGPSTHEKSPPAPQMCGVIPLGDAYGAAIWDRSPNGPEAASWKSLFHTPFHAALNAQVARVRAQNGFAVLLTITALRPPRDPAGPDFSLATFLSQSRQLKLSTDLQVLLEKHDLFRAQVSGSSTAGWITRAQGAPGRMVLAFHLRVRETMYRNGGTAAEGYDSELAVQAAERLGAVMETLNTLSG